MESKNIIIEGKYGIWKDRPGKDGKYVVGIVDHERSKKVFKMKGAGITAHNTLEEAKDALAIAKGGEDCETQNAQN